MITLADGLAKACDEFKAENHRLRALCLRLMDAINTDQRPLEEDLDAVHDLQRAAGEAGEVP